MKPASEEIPLVHQAWTKCAARLLPHGKTQLSQQLFTRYIYDRYTEPQRHYHTLEHLEEMLRYLVSYEEEHGWHGDYLPALAEAQKCLADTETTALTATSVEATASVRREWMGTVLLLSILFHDVVYDPTRADNEEKSAELVEEFLTEAQKLSGPQAPKESDASSSFSPLLWANAHAAEFVQETTVKYILKTKVHLAVEPAALLQLSDPPSAAAVAQSHDDPLHVFLDLDLSILGLSDPHKYQHRYAENIQREYSHYARPDFLKGRSAFLQGFLKHAQWFKTPYFFAQLETQSRHNVEGEAEELAAQLKTIEAAPSPSS